MGMHIGTIWQIWLNDCAQQLWVGLSSGVAIWPVSKFLWEILFAIVVKKCGLNSAISSVTMIKLRWRKSLHKLVFNGCYWQKPSRSECRASYGQSSVTSGNVTGRKKKWRWNSWDRSGRMNVERWRNARYSRHALPAFTSPIPSITINLCLHELSANSQNQSLRISLIASQSEIVRSVISLPQRRLPYLRNHASKHYQILCVYWLAWFW